MQTIKPETVANTIPLDGTLAAGTPPPWAGKSARAMRKGRALRRPARRGTFAALVLALLAMNAKAATGTIQDVQHVVILMQENRSFDHYFGSLKGVRGFNDANALLFPNGHTDFYQPYSTSYVLPFHLQIQCQTDVDHAESSGLAAWDNGKWDRWASAKGPPTMGYYQRADLAFYYALADAYTVCDEYHCSAIGPTYPNRLYLMTGMIDPTGQWGGPALDNSVPANGYRWTTYPERLQAAGVSWRVYQQSADYFPLNALAWFHQYTSAPAGDPLRVQGISLVTNLVAAFQSDVANGTLPTVSWLVPPWSLSEHPYFSPANGQILVKQLLDALAANPAVYNSTVFILTYDEDGGFFDHVASPVPPPGTTNEFVNGEPLGLGVRVPTILVSPWSRGGYVCSQVFDHTSVIQFLEHVTGVPEPNISAWRRQVCGDLTSAFDFSNPDTNYTVLPPVAPVNCGGGTTPSVPTPQVFPVQEAGTNLARPRPYRPNAISFADCTNNRVGITMTNAGTASAHFSVYANAYRGDGPWQYDVTPSNSVTAYFSVGGTGGRYDFTCYGSHRFHQRFAGNISANCTLLNVSASPNPDRRSVTLAMQNTTAAPVTFSVTNLLQPGGISSYTVLPGYVVTNTFDGAFDADGRYSLAASADSDASFLRQFVGDSDTTTVQFATNAPPVITNAPPAIPILRASASAGNLILTFPVWASTNALQSVTDLASGAWSVIPAALATNGANASVIIPITNAVMYFRLHP